MINFYYVNCLIKYLYPSLELNSIKNKKIHTILQQEIYAQIFKIKNKEIKLIILGLDGAGKTTALNKLKMNDIDLTIPTMGFNFESLKYKGLNFNLWDFGGVYKIRMLWRHYYYDTEGIIFVVDSNNENRVEEAQEEITKVLENEEINDCPCLVFSNKQDIKEGFSKQDITEKLGLNKLKNRQWMVQGTSSKRGQGLKEGLNWMAIELIKRKLIKS